MMLFKYLFSKCIVQLVQTSPSGIWFSREYCSFDYPSLKLLPAGIELFSPLLGRWIPSFHHAITSIDFIVVSPPCWVYPSRAQLRVYHTDSLLSEQSTEQSEQCSYMLKRKKKATKIEQRIHKEVIRGKCQALFKQTIRTDQSCSIYESVLCRSVSLSTDQV